MTLKHPPAVMVGLNDAALSIVRSLGRRGIRIIGLYDGKAPSYYAKSKYCSVRIQSPLTGEPLINTLIKISKDLGEQAVLFCTNDNSVLSVSMYADQVRPFFKFVIPSYDVTSTQISKKGFHEFALENSFLVPTTFFLKGTEDIRKIINSITFPCIIKPEYRDKSWNESVPEKVLFAETKEKFLILIEKYGIQDRSLAIQEWIDGDDTDVYFCLAYLNRMQRPLAVCTGRKLRQHPHLTGSTSIAVTIFKPDIVSQTIRLLTAAGCVGFCSVEFKESRKNGRIYITEPTIGRPDTQEGIFTSIGIDVPYIAYMDALGSDSNPIEYLKKNISWINEPLAFYIFQDYLKNGFNVKEFLSLCKGRHSFALNSFDDPMPALIFYKELIKKGFKTLRWPVFS